MNQKTNASESKKTKNLPWIAALVVQSNSDAQTTLTPQTPKSKEVPDQLTMSRETVTHAVHYCPNLPNLTSLKMLRLMTFMSPKISTSQTHIFTLSLFIGQKLLDRSWSIVRMINKIIGIFLVCMLILNAKRKRMWSWHPKFALNQL